MSVQQGAPAANDHTRTRVADAVALARSEDQSTIMHHALLPSSCVARRRVACAPMTGQRVLSPADYRRMPWKNGAGRTTEIAVHPAGAALDAFDWRVSVADVAGAEVERRIAVIFGLFDLEVAALLRVPPGCDGEAIVDVLAAVRPAWHDETASIFGLFQ
jgi:hypothetical protein